MELQIIDGSYFLHRAYYVAQKYKAGRELHILYNMLLPFKENTALVLDSKGKNFRHKIYPEYKGNRDKPSREYLSFEKKACSLVKAMGFYVLKLKGFEGDDIIGTLCNQATKKKIKTLVHTGDKDMAQYVTRYVTLYNPILKRFTDKKSLKKTLGIKPKQVPCYLALIGDDLDNIPGINGVGPKTATKLLQEYSSVKSIYKKSKSLKGKVGETIRENKAQLKLSRKLTAGITVPGISIEKALCRVTANKTKVNKLLTVKKVM